MSEVEISPFHLRPRRADDAAGIAALRNMPGVRNGTMALPFSSIASVEAHLARSKPTDHMVVAEAADHVIGCASIHCLEGRRAHTAGLGITVSDAWHGRGVGTALMAALIDLADNWLALRRIELTVFADNEPALALYRKFDFTIEGRFRGYALRNGALIDALSMARLRV
jgi:putative acetyltransferase